MQSIPEISVLTTVQESLAAQTERDALINIRILHFVHQLDEKLTAMMRQVDVRCNSIEYGMYTLNKYVYISQT